VVDAFTALKVYLLAGLALYTAFGARYLLGKSGGINDALQAGLVVVAVITVVWFHNL
jgi:hypothetical protein